MRAERGFTLLEIVIGLVVTSIVMLIVTDLLGAQAQQAWGEGENWTQSYGMTPVGGDHFTIWPSDSPHFITELRPC